MKEKNSFKFRAWDKTTNQMRGCYGFNTMEQEVYVCNVADDEFTGRPKTVHAIRRAFDEVVLMQYTGLRDKNGLEIFDGDIIVNRYGDYSAIGIGKYDRKYQEEFDNQPRIYNLIGVYEYTLNDSTSGKLSYEFELSDAERSEVVGNIWEDSELLEVTEE